MGWRGLIGQVRALTDENRALRDEVLRLKGLPRRPPTRPTPSGMEAASEGGAGPRTASPTAASILILLAGIERHGPDAPAAAAFRSALRRNGIEVDAAGGLRALEELLHAVAEADPSRADVRAASSGLRGPI